MHDPLNTLLELEHAGWSSLCEGSASHFFGDLMMPDARMILANGTVMTRDEVIESLRHAPPWSSYEIEQPSTITVADDVVALHYTGTGHRDDGSTFTAIMSSLYVAEGDVWKLMLYQQTPVD